MSNPSNQLDRAVERTKTLLGSQIQFAQAVYRAAKELAVDPDALFAEMHRRRAIRRRNRDRHPSRRNPIRAWESAMEPPTSSLPVGDR